MDGKPRVESLLATGNNWISSNFSSADYYAIDDNIPKFDSSGSSSGNDNDYGEKISVTNSNHKKSPSNEELLSPLESEYQNNSQSKEIKLRKSIKICTLIYSTIWMLILIGLIYLQVQNSLRLISINSIHNQQHTMLIISIALIGISILLGIITIATLIFAKGRFTIPLQITVFASSTAIIEALLNSIYILTSDNSQSKCYDSWQLSYLWIDCQNGLSTSWRIAAIVRLILTVIFFLLCFISGYALRKCNAKLAVTRNSGEEKYIDGKGSFILVSSPSQSDSFLIESNHKRIN